MFIEVCDELSVLCPIIAITVCVSCVYNPSLTHYGIMFDMMIMLITFMYNIIAERRCSVFRRQRGRGAARGRDARVRRAPRHAGARRPAPTLPEYV